MSEGSNRLRVIEDQFNACQRARDEAMHRLAEEIERGFWDAPVISLPPATKPGWLKRLRREAVWRWHALRRWLALLICPELADEIEGDW